MIGDVVVDPSTRARQQIASNPRLSVWVSANAGAGKTKVLTDRVIRLMLDGSPPSRILCLTFTKAAAAEMTIRVFGTLGEWVTLDEAALKKALLELTGDPADSRTRARARRLFAQAVETPGGLKIETIHAFCERVLHLVPFEANVPARFTVLDDGQAAELKASARASVLKEAASGEPRFRPLASALEVVASHLSGDRLTQLIDAAVDDARMPEGPDAIAAATARLATVLGIDPAVVPDDVRREATEGGLPRDAWPALAAALAATGKANDRALGEALTLAARAPNLEGRFDHYWSVFFIDTGSPRQKWLTKGVPAPIRETLETEQARLVPLRHRLLAAEAVERTSALFSLAGAVRAKTVELKRGLGALDFADLIAKTLELLDRGAAPWILYRLDQGIDHVLVDEAQDTNHDQWRILRRLTEEFTAGAGRPARAPRTVFAVGDPKQSIYSFQGADPRLFEEGRHHWATRHVAARLRFEHVRLDLSFRSAPAILGAVDNTFGVASHFRGLSFDETVTGTTHTSARPKAAGQVEIWPTETAADAEPDPDAWSDPVDQPRRDSPAAVVANRVARAVRAWIDGPDEVTGRVWHPRDILVLARKRGPAFFACIRALKAAGIAVAGADRIDVGEQIAVSDLVAAGQAAILPENDLVLAAALKSPLVGLDDDDLVRIAADRGEAESLAAALERAAATDPHARAGWEALCGWQGLARAHGPFGFYATLLGPEGGRRLLVERLGGEAADAIDTFLGRAQAEEAGGRAPSLTAFLHLFETAEHVIKRDPEAVGDMVRVMTVHGAKGLEAPLVVLLDGCDVLGPDPKLIAVRVGPAETDVLPVWAPGSASDPPLVGEARTALRARAGEEHHRLLYVALTRARDRLVVAPFHGGKGDEPSNAWCRMVRHGFEVSGQALVRTQTCHGPVDLWQDGIEDAVVGRASLRPSLVAVPAWLTTRVEPEPEPGPPLRPSGALGAASRRPPARRPPAGVPADARRSGILVHALLDHLADAPSASRRDMADRFLLARAGALPPPDRNRIVEAALGVLAHPALAPLFGPGSRGEVAVAGRIGPPGRERSVSGQIDRLLVRPDAIWLADVKTGRAPPDGTIPDAYLGQLALYRALLAAIHPGRPVRALLVWTVGPHVVEPAAALLDRALEATLAGLP